MRRHRNLARIQDATPFRAYFAPHKGAQYTGELDVCGANGVKGLLNTDFLAKSGGSK